VVNALLGMYALYSCDTLRFESVPEVHRVIGMTIRADEPIVLTLTKAVTHREQCCVVHTAVRSCAGCA
jgi:hypothetical protein